jgi:transcriptional regulator with XRE-family HTH domain
MFDIAEILTAARLRAGMSQRVLAHAAGTSQPAIAKLERGETSPTVATLERLVNAAGFELRFELVPRRTRDALIEAYKPGVDRSLLRENLRRSVNERIAGLIELQEAAAELDRAGRTARRRRRS